MKLSIHGIGSVSASGCGAASLLAALQGSSAPRIEYITVPVAAGQFALPVYRATVDGLDQFVDRRSLRRLDKFAKMALLASLLALEDAGFNQMDRSRLGLILGTSYGPLETAFRYQDTIIDDGDRGASPTLFANSVHSYPTSEVSILLKIEGPCLTFSNFELTTTEVLRTASMWLEQGTVDYVLAGVGDEHCGPLAYVSRQEGAGESSRPQPLLFDRCSYVPAEGFVVFFLGSGSEEGKYGTVHHILTEYSPKRINHTLLDRHRILFLSANGAREVGRRYEQLGLASTKVAAYAPLYGSLPVGLGFDLALASISCAAGRLYPSAAENMTPGLDILTQSLPLADQERVGCLECSPRHDTLVSISRC